MPYLYINTEGSAKNVCIYDDKYKNKFDLNALTLDTKIRAIFEPADGKPYETLYEGFSKDKWYYMKLIFNTDSDTYNVYLDDVLIGNEINFYNSQTSVANLIFQLGYVRKGIWYVDAIGYSWDPNYMIGDNLHETDMLIEGIAESQVARGDIVNIDFITNTYSEVQMKFVNNDVVQETYTILPRK